MTKNNDEIKVLNNIIKELNDQNQKLINEINAMNLKNTLQNKNDNKNDNEIFNNSKMEGNKSERIYKKKALTKSNLKSSNSSRLVNKTDISGINESIDLTICKSDSKSIVKNIKSKDNSTLTTNTKHLDFKQSMELKINSLITNKSLNTSNNVKSTPKPTANKTVNKSNTTVNKSNTTVNKSKLTPTRDDDL
jgi:hypothetical protein